VRRDAIVLILGLLPWPAVAIAAGASTTVSGGYWRATSADAPTRTVFGGEPDGLVLAAGIEYPARRHVSIFAALQYKQDRTVHGLRQTGTRPEVVVSESVRLRVIDLQPGVRVHAGPERSVSPYAQVSLGPMLIRQTLTDVRIPDDFTPESTSDWKLAFQLAGGAEARRGSAAIGLEIAWFKVIGDVKLSQLFEPRTLDGWSLSARLRFGL
jgi:hypothetical protein